MGAQGQRQYPPQGMRRGHAGSQTDVTCRYAEHQSAFTQLDAYVAETFLDILLAPKPTPDSRSEAMEMMPKPGRDLARQNVDTSPGFITLSSQGRLAQPRGISRECRSWDNFS